MSSRHSTMEVSGHVRNVGIKGMEIYFPSKCVDQRDLELHDGVSEGKYTIGLGQTKMSVCNDREDIYSFALTAVSSLLKKYGISPNSIGRLEVGTETILDKSKSVKSVLMQLFSPTGNNNIEGVDTINACYGGTNALLNAVNWLESRAWDGRDAIVVAGDIAVYQAGSARPTGGAGVVAMLVGPDAPIVLESGRRGTYMDHTYDFYKPDFSSEYPMVDGQYSNECYVRALDACYKDYVKSSTGGKFPNIADGDKSGYCDAVTNGLKESYVNENSIKTSSTEAGNGTEGIESEYDSFDYMCFHSPNCKLVTKSFARLLYDDFIAHPSRDRFKDVPTRFLDIPYEESLSNKEIEKLFVTLSKQDFVIKTQPSLTAPTMCGNMYTASLYSSMASLLCNIKPNQLLHKRVGMFSYGSGIASSLFSLRIVGDVTPIAEKLKLHDRLDQRRVISPAEYEQALFQRERAHQSCGFVAAGDTDHLAPGTFYLTHVDDRYRRNYEVQA